MAEKNEGLVRNSHYAKDKIKLGRGKWEWSLATRIIQRLFIEMLQQSVSLLHVVHKAHTKFTTDWCMPVPKCNDQQENPFCCSRTIKTIAKWRFYK